MKHFYDLSATSLAPNHPHREQSNLTRHNLFIPVQCSLASLFIIDIVIPFQRLSSEYLRLDPLETRRIQSHENLFVTGRNHLLMFTKNLSRDELGRSSSRSNPNRSTKPQITNVRNPTRQRHIIWRHRENPIERPLRLEGIRVILAPLR